MPSENAQGQPYCQEMWCTTLSPAAPRLASTWLLGTDGQTWKPCCDFCLGRWVSLTAAGSLSTAPMYVTEPVAAAGPAAAAAAPQGLLARYRAWKAANRAEASLAETAALYATWGVVHHAVKEQRERSAALFQERSAASRAGSELHRQQVADQSAYQAANWGPREH